MPGLSSGTATGLLIGDEYLAVWPDAARRPIDTDLTAAVVRQSLIRIPG
jgi:hypothetical protein